MNTTITSAQLAKIQATTDALAQREPGTTNAAPAAEMIEVKAGELIGLALDYAVGLADGRELELPSAVRGRKHVVWCDPFEIRLRGEVIGHDKTRRNWLPSTDWAQGGPLIDKFNPEERQALTERYAEVWIDLSGGDAKVGQGLGATRLIAACRAIVAAKLGPVVSVPLELMP